MATYSQSAYDVMVAMLREWGLEELAPEVLNLLQQGNSQDQVAVLIQDTETYKKRFAGNELRKKNGLSVLSPGEYLATERAYRQILSSNGLPEGFFDHPSDYASWIGKDVSPTEIGGRVSLAVEAANRMDPALAQSFRDFYGVGPNDLAAFFLDQDRAMPLIQKIGKAAAIGGVSNAQGLNTTRERAEYLAGVSGDRDVVELMNQVAAVDVDARKIGSTYGVEWSQADAEEEVFNSSDAARRKRKNLADMEVGSFTGSSGTGRTTFEQKKNY
jgi:hypothetical protein